MRYIIIICSACVAILYGQVVQAEERINSVILPILLCDIKDYYNDKIKIKNNDVEEFCERTSQLNYEETFFDVYLLSESYKISQDNVINILIRRDNMLLERNRLHIEKFMLPEYFSPDLMVTFLGASHYLSKSPSLTAAMEDPLLRYIILHLKKHTYAVEKFSNYRDMSNNNYYSNYLPVAYFSLYMLSRLRQLSEDSIPYKNTLEYAISTLHFFSLSGTELNNIYNYYLR